MTGIAIILTVHAVAMCALGLARYILPTWAVVAAFWALSVILTA